MALNTSFTYLGVALGGMLGGVALDLAGVGFLAPISLVLATLAVGVLHMSRKSEQREDLCLQAGRTVDRVCLPIPTSPFEIAR
ncbi:hypothetical protein SAMN04244548_03783 [Paracoccus pantotrophus]|nr:hypothetical protein SAMN04244548_03783 [Paracoccus pantotrophus]